MGAEDETKGGCRMTHNELMLLHEAATAGWYGARAREAMLGLVHSQNSFDSEDWATYYARMAARAALRAINALEDDSIYLLR